MAYVAKTEQHLSEDRTKKFASELKGSLDPEKIYSLSQAHKEYIKVHAKISSKSFGIYFRKIERNNIDPSLEVVREKKKVFLSYNENAESPIKPAYTPEEAAHLFPNVRSMNRGKGSETKKSSQQAIARGERITQVYSWFKSVVPLNKWFFPKDYLKAIQSKYVTGLKDESLVVYLREYKRKACDPDFKTRQVGRRTVYMIKTYKKNNSTPIKDSSSTPVSNITVDTVVSSKSKPKAYKCESCGETSHHDARFCQWCGEPVMLSYRIEVVYLGNKFEKKLSSQEILDIFNAKKFVVSNSQIDTNSRVIQLRLSPYVGE